VSDWPELERFLATDPRDVGCERAREILHVYVDLVLSGVDPERTHPGVAAHLRACGPCAEDFDGLLAAARDAQGGDAGNSERT
jgi:hypothetical protein